MVKHTHNLSQLNPVAPAALGTEFKTHDKTSYPFKRTRDFPKLYKAVLRSGDRISGTEGDAQFQIKLPNDFQDYAVCVVESFYIKGSNNALATTPYSCHIRELIHPNSYQSSNGLGTDVIFSTVGYSYKNDAQVGSVGCPIQNGYFFNSRTINVYFTSQTDISSALDEWVLTLAFYQE